MKPVSLAFRFPSLYRMIVGCCLVGGWPFSPLGAQCACEDQINVSVDQNCMATLSANVLLEDPAACAGSLSARVVQSNGALVVESGFPLMLPAGLEGDTLLFTVLVDGTPTCGGLLLMRDDLPPTILAPTDTLFCHAPTDTGQVASVLITDNCDPLPLVSFSDQEIGPECDSLPDFLGKILRTYVAQDASGNVAVATQTLVLLPVPLDSVLFPPDTALDCGVTGLGPDTTGFPSLEGSPLLPGSGFCRLDVLMEDDTFDLLCPLAVQRIRRTWTLTDLCSGEQRSAVQTIDRIDTLPPEFTCPNLPLFGTDPGLCSGTVVIMEPTALDNCSSVSFSLNTSYGQTQFGAFSGVEVGVHSVEITATDACGNIARCTLSLEVFDSEVPTATCDEITSVSLSTDGKAMVPASIFDDGSTDNCSALEFLASRDGAPFAPLVTFDCADVGQLIPVTVRVRELNDTTSFNDCMVLVEVEDKLAPQILCPPDVTVDCHEDLSDLNAFGAPLIFDNCSATLIQDTLFEVGVCGTGTVQRIFVVEDPSGNGNSCIQTIHVENQQPFDGSTIQWPEDFTTFECIPPDQLDPEDLPADSVNFSAPVVPPTECALIAQSYEDQLFDIEPPACYKIVRRWTLIDWCQFDVHNPGVGTFTHTQLITVMDTLPPEVVFCPTDTVFGVDSLCQFGMVTLPPVEALDCSPGVEITNDSPFAFDDGADASGWYPPGEHLVRFTVQDGCGNRRFCTVRIEVVDDKPPTPVCKNGLVLEIQDMGSGPMAALPAVLLDDKSFDNCSQNLHFTIRMQGDTLPPVDTLFFDCTALRFQTVELWVTDEAGNSDFCIVTVDVQDNMGLCSGGQVVSLSGTVFMENQQPVSGVALTLEGLHTRQVQTDAEGRFRFEDAPAWQSQTLTPTRTGDWLNGVTTFDIVLLMRHILGVQPLDSPYKIIAADINASGKITTADVVALKRVILQMEESFPDNQSWRFVDADYLFVDPQNPLEEAFPEWRDLPPSESDLEQLDFIAVKVGDLNHSARTDALQTLEGREEEAVHFTVREVWFSPGQTLEVPVFLGQALRLTGLQGAFRWDDRLLDLVSILPGQLSKVHFGGTEPALLPFCWFTSEGAALRPEPALFTLRFRTRGAGALSQAFGLAPEQTFRAEAYVQDEPGPGIPHPLTLHFQTNPTAAMNAPFELLQNRPNPFKKATTIRFRLPEDSSAALSVFDFQGRLLKRIEGTFRQGLNEIRLDRTELQGSGVLYYQLETPTARATRKMILLH